MNEWLEFLLKISIAVFMAGNLLAMGLVLKLKEAYVGLRHTRFVILSLLMGFVVGPAIAWALAVLVPMNNPLRWG